MVKITHKKCSCEDCKKSGEMYPLSDFAVDRRNKKHGRTARRKACINKGTAISPITDQDRAKIYRLKSEGFPLSEIARKMSRHQDTIEQVLREDIIMESPQFLGFMQHRAGWQADARL